MSIITIDTAALATIVQELTAEKLAGLGAIFLDGRTKGIDALHRRLLQLARDPQSAPMASLADHPDVIGPVAWHHQLPEGERFLGGRNTQVVESLQEALGHKDRFGGTLAPLFKLASVGNSDTWATEHVQEQPPTAGDAGPRKNSRSAPEPQAFELPTGRPLIHDIGAAVDAASAEAAAAGIPGANKPANEGGFTSPATLFLIVAVLFFVGAVSYALKPADVLQAMKPPMPTPGANVAYAPFVFIDDTTGCNYLSTHSSTGLAPRIAADGKTHMGCKGGNQ